MDEKKLEEVLEQLMNSHRRKTDLRLAKANMEIQTINREDVAYYDGAYDAISKIRLILREEEAKTNG